MNRTYWTIAIHLLCGVSFLALPYIFAPKGFSQMAEIAHNPHEQPPYWLIYSSSGSFICFTPATDLPCKE
jgi:hypothetical protein